MTNNKALFLDDERFPKNVKWIELPLEQWVIVRSYKEFSDWISRNGLPRVISFDNDLADQSYGVNWEEAARDGKFTELNASLREKTGYDCAKFLVNYCLDKELDLPQYYVHSMNSVAKDYIISLLESFKKRNA